MLNRGFRDGLIKDKRHELGPKNSWDLEKHRERPLNYEYKQNTYLGRQRAVHGTVQFSNTADHEKDLITTDV